MVRLPVSLLLILLGRLAAAAEGGQDQDVDLELFRPYADATGYFSVPSSATLKHLQVGGSFWFQYENDPLVLVYEGLRTVPVSAIVDGDDGDGILDDRLSANVQLGIGLSRFFSISLDVPMTLWQDGYDLNTIDNPTAEPDLLIGTGVGDVRLVPKLVALDLDHVPVGLAVLMPVSFPSGSGSSFLGEDAFTVTPTAVFELSDGSIRERKYGIRFAASAGYRARDSDELRNVELGNAVVYGAALGLRPADPIEFIAEFAGNVYGQSSAQHPAEICFGLKGLPGDLLTLNLGGAVGVLGGVGAPDYRIFAGISVAPSFDPCTLDKDRDSVVNCEDRCLEEAEDDDDFRDEDGCPDPDNDADGLLDEEDSCPLDPEDDDGYRDSDGCPDPDNDKDGIVDDDDQCPDDPETVNDHQDEDGCPDERPIEDTDGDGYKDDVDRCPRDPEDFDQWQDEDGCPDPDNDGDAILDPDDRCPNDREVFNGIDDEDGCPDEGRVVVEQSSIRILEKIFFDFNKATIQPVSFSLLDEIAAVITAHPELLRIRIEGHTDAVGNDVYNLKLSQARADAVKEALVARGVEGLRLDAAGFGEMRPIDSNDTEEGKAVNRRVEFIIVDRQ